MNIPQYLTQYDMKYP